MKQNSATEFWQKLSPRDKKSLLLLFVFLILIGGYLVCIEPFYIKFKKLVSQKQQLISEIESKRSAAASIFRREVRLEEVRQENDYLLEKLVVENSGAHTLGDLLHQIKQYGQEAGIEISQITPIEISANKEYQELPLQISLNGTYLAISRFLHFIETSKLLLVVSDLRLNSDNSNILSATLQLIKISLNIEQLAEITENNINIKQNNNHLRIGLEYWPGYAPFYVAEKFGWLTTDDFSVQLIYSSDDDELAMLAASNDLDGLCIPLTDQIYYLEKGFDFKAFYPVAFGNGSESIMVRKDSAINSVAELVNHNFYGEGRLAEYLLFRAFEKNDLADAFKNISFNKMNVRMVAQGLETGSITAGVVWNPYSALLQEENRVREIFSSKLIPGEIVENLVFVSDVFDSKGEILPKLASILDKSVAWINENPMEAAKILAAQFHMHQKEVEKGFQQVRFITPETRKELFGCAEQNKKGTIDNIILQHERFYENLYQGRAELPLSEIFSLPALEDIIDCSSESNKENKGQNKP